MCSLGTKEVAVVDSCFTILEFIRHFKSLQDKKKTFFQTFSLQPNIGYLKVIYPMLNSCFF